ncbi:MAG: Mth938-like domain-containing protein [Gammaproteobacteria bacterium]
MEILRDSLLESGRPAVRRYKPGELGVQGSRYTQSVVLTTERVINDWPPQSADAIEAAHLEILLELDPRPEIVLIGTGERQIFPSREVLAPLINAGTGFEIMDTRAACRTWNILLSEDRHAAAALILR